MNYKSLANKGRYGDSEIRNVAGRTSHVNPGEADIIDLWGALGESLVQREGAGTRNPKTGMPEYHGSAFGGFKKSSWPAGHPAHHMNLGEGTAYVLSGGTVDISGGGEGSVVNYGGTEDPTDLTLQNPLDTDTSPSGDPGSQDPPYEPGDPGYVNPPDPPGTDVDTGDTADYQAIQEAILSGTYLEQYDYNDDNVLDNRDIVAGQNTGGLEYTQTETINDWEDMTKSQFKSMIEQGRGSEIAEGFLGEQFGEGDFEDVFDTSDFDLITRGYDLSSETLGEQKKITGGILQGRLDTAKGQYGRGLEAAGYNVGKSLFDIKGQVEGQQSKGGFAGSGFIASTGERAKRGVFQDYRAQQRELSAGLGEAQTAFGFGEQQMDLDFTSGIDRADLTRDISTSDYWSNKYSDFYDRLWSLENPGE